MASPIPGSFAYKIAGKSVGFINSDDCKYTLTGQPAYIEVVDFGIVRPSTASLNATGSAPELTGIRTPATVSLSQDGQPVYTDRAHSMMPTTGGLSLSGKVPSLGAKALPTTGSLSMAGQPVKRKTFSFASDAPLVIRADVVYPLLETLAFTGYAPNPFVATTPSYTRVPETANLAASGKLPTSNVGNIALPTVGSIAYSGKIPNTNPVAYPARARLGIVGQSVSAGDASLGRPSVTITGPFNFGTVIRNKSALEYDSKINVDARTGFKVKPGALISDAYGVLTEPDHADRKHPADMGQRARREHHTGATRQSDIGRETFIDPDDPVDPDDY